MGEAGNDILTGGAGRYTFVFNAGADRITDFCIEVDKLVLDDALWSGTRSAARIIDDFAIVTDSDILFDFGGGNTLTLQDIGSAAGLDYIISFIPTGVKPDSRGGFPKRVKSESMVVGLGGFDHGCSDSFTFGL
jgi:Ca2+-binding RTX toxin-like protein